ncbi:MAG: HD domain-containing protein [Alphaproteobacteria bacterium]|nr:HD domain-containing protein [Alphaproteobacteria bacterium]
MKNLLKHTQNLKHLQRTGWKRKNISNPETVASHSWNMAMIALYLEKEFSRDYDIQKVINLCLVHDLGESIIGDITPDEKSYQNKQDKEIEAIKTISANSSFDKLYDLFIEYEENKTKEANLAHDLDQIDMYAQSLYYENEDSLQNLEEFRNSALSKIKTQCGLSLINKLK